MNRKVEFFFFFFKCPTLWDIAGSLLSILMSKACLPLEKGKRMQLGKGQLALNFGEVDDGLT